jgi:pimeloyl-ACP methyl ester carboxylesterase
VTGPTSAVGSPLHVQRIGRLGPTVLLVHGDTPAAGNAWLPQRPLRDRHRLLIPDRFGFGASPPTDGLDADVDARAALDAVDEPLHLVGHSHGAVVALLIAASRPDVVRSLLLIEPPLLRHASSGRDASPDALDARAVSLGLVGAATHPRFPTAAWRRGRRPWDVAVDLDAIRVADVPTLVVSGGWSPILEAVCDDVAERTSARREVLAGAGHDVHRTGPAFNELASAFWRQVDEGDDAA